MSGAGFALRRSILLLLMAGAVTHCSCIDRSEKRLAAAEIRALDLSVGPADVERAPEEHDGRRVAWIGTVASRDVTRFADGAPVGTASFLGSPRGLAAKLAEVCVVDPLDIRRADCTETTSTFRVVRSPNSPFRHPGPGDLRDLWPTYGVDRPMVWIGEVRVERGVATVEFEDNPIELRE